MNQDLVAINKFINLIPFTGYYDPILLLFIIYNILSYIYAINFVNLFMTQ